ncbi:MAG TPA: hypothetical protein VHG32_01025 [Thermoanaerobaculia bacterium]|jgi:hypothetical protein|nr:hypothetical protein [Thermoanaerobaculia bacterium]
METAKVDIRKLQLLNDRINQSIDALNQVRLSVHGLSHTAGVNPNLPTGAAGFGIGQQQGVFPQLQQGGFPQVAGGFPQAQPGIFPQIFGGLSHTPMPYGVAQAGLNPYLGFGGVQQPGLNPYAGIGGVTGGWNPYAQLGQIGQFGGLSHSGQEMPDPVGRTVWNDPWLAARVVQTFPYAQFAVPPVVTLY